MNRVYITGLGLVSPQGANVNEFWASMLAESTAPGVGYDELADRIDNRFIYVCEGTMAGEEEAGRANAFSMEAVSQALDDADIQPGQALGCGVAVGSSMGDEASLERYREVDAEQCECKDYPFQVSAAIAGRYGLCGPNLTISNACTSGLYALDYAAGVIRSGEAEMMVAGGVESASRIVLSCFNRLGALDQGLCRPFDASRNGTVLAEGAAYVVLESEESMRRRGFGSAYCEYKGSGWSCDAYQPTAPEPQGVQITRALRTSLSNSGLQADDIDCVLPHGTGTPLNDSLEAGVLTQTFGHNRHMPILTAIKSKVGHSGGASGAFSVVTACLILKHDRIPPTANLEKRDEGFTLPIPVGDPVEHQAVNILVNAYAFGGNNISVVLGKR